MKSLREILKDSERRHVSVGHFNVSDLVALKASHTAEREGLSPTFKNPCFRLRRMRNQGRLARPDRAGHSVHWTLDHGAAFKAPRNRR